ncbi:APC family permease [Mycolicibacterium houstonense]|uniref:APC family permease n=1 Tax=Mycolicibacterium houstonense TaxID=146021 RepID=UPI00082D3826|nr:APC family permease [Mycolicibacterium houstonense]
MTEVATGPADKGLRRDIGKLGLLFVSCGAIIGSSWLFVPITALQIAGPSAIVSWFIAIALITVIMLTYAELSAMFPVAGGVTRFPQYSYGSFTSYTVGWITWLGVAAVPPIEVLATLQYSSSYIPGLFRTEAGAAVLTPIGIAVAVVLMGMYTVVNILGVRFFARINNVMVWWKLTTVAVMALALLAMSFDGDVLTSTETGGFAPFGFGAIFAAVSSGGVLFTLMGARQAVELAAETTKPKVNIPFALIGSILICGAILIGLQIAVAGSIPRDVLTGGGWSDLTVHHDIGPLAGLAGALGLVWLVVLIRVDAVISPLDTGLIYAASAARLSYAQGRNGNAPQWLTLLNKRGVPWTSMLLMFAVGCLFFLPLPSWQRLAAFITTATVLAFGAGPVVMGALRRQLPAQERPFKVPGGDVIPFLALLAASFIVYWAGWSTNMRVFIAVAVGYIVLGLHYRFAKDRTLIPPLQLKQGAWILIWFSGLAVISWLGTYGDGLGVLNEPTSAVALVALSAVSYAVGQVVRLTTAEVEDNIERQRIADESTPMAEV